MAGANESGTADASKLHAPGDSAVPAAAQDIKNIETASPRKRCRSRVKFLLICVILPVCNGLLCSMLWSANSLHYQEQGWPLWRLGLLGLVSALARLVMAQLSNFFGPWFSLMINVVHLGCLVPALVTVQEERYVALQIFMSIAFDAVLTNDAIVFFHFSESESEATYATSAQLQCYVLGYASASTIGGAIYDLARWPGIVIAHFCLQVVVCGVLVVEPCVHQSIADLCRRCHRRCHTEDLEEAEMSSVLPGSESAGPSIRVVAVPPTEQSLPGAVAEDLDQDDAALRNRPRSSTGGSDTQKVVPAAERPQHALNTLSPETADQAVVGPVGQRRRFHSNVSRGSQDGRSGVQRNSRFRFSLVSLVSAVSDGSHSSQAKRLHEAWAHSMQYQRGSLQRGSLMMCPPPLPVPAEKSAEAESPQSRLPRSLWLPAFLAGLFSCMYNFAYVTEFVLFAIYFKEQHNWHSATWAGVAQSSGDILAAVILQLIARFAPPSPEKEQAGFDAGGATRAWYSISAKPYNLVWFCLWWVVLCMGMTVPNLPVVIVSQVVMGTLYVTCIQGATKLNTYYSLGDANVFISLQLIKLNAEAVGMSLSTLTAMVLYEQVHPNAPFILSAALNLCALIVIFVGFYLRVGCGQSLEAREAQRAARLGLSRQKSWK